MIILNEGDSGVRVGSKILKKGETTSVNPTFYNIEGLMNSVNIRVFPESNNDITSILYYRPNATIMKFEDFLSKKIKDLVKESSIRVAKEFSDPKKVAEIIRPHVKDEDALNVAMECDITKELIKSSAEMVRHVAEDPTSVSTVTLKPEVKEEKVTSPKKRRGRRSSKAQEVENPTITTNISELEKAKIEAKKLEEEFKVQNTILGIDTDSD